MKSFVLLAVLSLTGCSAFRLNVPANRVRFESAYGSLTLEHPHNTAMTNVYVRISTNGTVTASIGALNTVNDAQVIDAVSLGEIGKINALGTQLREGVKAGIEAAGGAAGAAVK